MGNPRTRTRVPLWLTGVAMTGASALVLAAAVFWTLVSAPSPAAAAAGTPAFVLELGRWAWHLVRAIAAWM